MQTTSPLAAATLVLVRASTFASRDNGIRLAVLLLFLIHLQICALMSGAELFVRDDLGLTDEQVEVLSGSMNMFMLASILAAGWAADAIGRRGTVVIANAFLMAGALAMSLGGSLTSLMAARFVTSVGVGDSESHEEEPSRSLAGLCGILRVLQAARIC